MLISKLCLNCKREFPGYVVVEGRKRNLQHRKYCLDCSPFGSGLKRRLPGDERPYKRTRAREAEFGDRLSCLECGRVYIYERDKGHNTVACNSCNANRKRMAMKERAVAYKGGQCQRCGYSKCLRALHFHHKERQSKEFGIGAKMSWKWERIIAELDKCTLLCSNCHCEVHEYEDESRKQALRTCRPTVGLTPD